MEENLIKHNMVSSPYLCPSVHILDISLATLNYEVMSLMICAMIDLSYNC
jgi:hypothetical protein